MDSPLPRRPLLAFAGPFILFCALQALPGLIKPAHPHWAPVWALYVPGQPGHLLAATPWWLAAPEFWVYPLQTVLCGAMLLFFRRDYPRAAGAAGLLIGAVVGVAAFALWISPQALLHYPPRLDGFNPMRLLHPLPDPRSGLAQWTTLEALRGGPVSDGAHAYAGPVGRGNFAYWLTVVFRFLRLVVVVPWLEEVFWRGFLLRYLVREDFLAVPFGMFARLSFGVVTAGFMFEHALLDWPAALATGALYNGVAIRTRSLPACILAHALTNLLLGGYVMWTQQWGFW